MKNAKTSTVKSEIKKDRRIRVIKRTLYMGIIFLVLLIAGTISLNKALRFNNEKIVSYSEKSNIDYRVYLIDNSFYEQEYLTKDMVYVASLIDKIEVDFDYQFLSNDRENIDFTYSIVAKLVISNPNTKKTYYSKSYTLVNEKTINMRDTMDQNIKEKISIDYGDYNQIANKFKSQYGVDSESNLTIYMLVNKDSADEKKYNLNATSTMNVVIPLSERSIDIHLDYKEIDETRNIIKTTDITAGEIILISISVILILISLILVIRIARNIKKLLRKKSPYDKFVSKILKEYDRLIAESASLLSFDKKEIVKINKFTELLDIHDNLQLPIMFYEEIKHELSYFYISHNDVIYLLTVEDKDFESETETVKK